MIQECAGQVRVAGLGGILGLDFTAIYAHASARGADLRLLAEVLPEVEGFIVFAWSKPS